MTVTAQSVPMPARSIVARWLIPGAIISAAIGGLVLAGFEAFRPAVPVRVAPVVMLDGAARSGPASTPAQALSPASTPAQALSPARSPARWVQAPGWIEPDPQPVIVSALRDGIVEQILVLEGDRVERGAAVAELESRSAVLALARAEAELARANAERERALAMAEDARTEEAQLPFRRAAAQARYDAARDASERADRLALTNAMGESEVVRFRNAMLEARAELEVIEPRQRAINAAIRAAEANAASATLVPKAMLDEAALAVERSTVRSQMDGIVMEVHAGPGQNLFAGDMALGRAVVTLYDPRKLRVRADVPLADAAGLAIGQRARVTVEVLPNRVFDGVISRLVHKADIQKNTVGVKVSLLDPSEELKPDMLARVRIEIGGDLPNGGAAPAARAGPPAPITDLNAPAPITDVNASSANTESARLVARADALIGDGPERRAFIVTALDRGRGRVAARVVRVGADAARTGWISIREGLAVGDRVIVAPSPSIEDGTTVQVIETILDAPETLHATR